jgi:hypothetical protein
MKHRMAFAAIATSAIIAGACADQDGGKWLGTEPRDAAPTLRYVTTASAAIVDPHSHRLIRVRDDDGSRARARASVVAVNGGESDALQLPATAPGVAHTSGYAKQSFVDSGNHKHSIVFLYGGTGGPPSAIQHYVDGSLVSTTAYTWTRTSSGWVRTSSLYQAVRNGTLYGSYATKTTLRNTGGSGPPQTVRLDRREPVGPLRKIAGGAAYALAFAFAPQDATAQMYFAECSVEWLRYAAAASALVAVYAAIIDVPVLTPILIFQLSGAIALAGVAEDALISCMLAHDTLAMHGFGGAGSASGAGSPQWDCFIGSYAAHCTTPFTL